MIQRFKDDALPVCDDKVDDGGNLVFDLNRYIPENKRTKNHV